MPMPKEVLEAKYQNFYVNDNGTVCGIVTPKMIWKIFEPDVLLNKYQKTLEKLKQYGNYEPMKIRTRQLEKNIKQLKKAMEKKEEII